MARPDKNHRHTKVSLPFYGRVALGNGTAYTVGAFMVTRTRMFVAVEGRGAYTFEGGVHEMYLQEKLLGHSYPADAGCFADWVNDQLGDYEFGRQGEYQGQFCDEEGVA